MSNISKSTKKVTDYLINEAKEVTTDSSKRFTGDIIDKVKEQAPKLAVMAAETLEGMSIGKIEVKDIVDTSAIRSFFASAPSPAAAKNAIRSGGKIIGATPAAMLCCVQQLYAQYSDLQQVREEEITKREQIQAKKEIVLSQISTIKEMFITYMDKSFDERKENFARFFDVVDTALENDNMRALQMGLQSINQLAAESPFKAIADMNILAQTMDANDELDI